MKKLILIFLLLLASNLIVTSVNALTPGQQIQYFVAPVSNVEEQPMKASRSLLVGIEEMYNKAKEVVDKINQQYTAITDAIAAQVDWAKEQIITSLLGGDPDLNKTKTTDEAPGAKEMDGVKERVKTNMNNNFKGEAAAGAEAENKLVENRKKKRQENNSDKLARVLVVKHQLGEIGTSIVETEEMLKAGLDKVANGTSSIEEALKINAQLRLIWYNLLTAQMKIETYNLDAKSSQGLASMLAAAMEMEYSDDYLLKVSDK